MKKIKSKEPIGEQDMEITAESSPPPNPFNPAEATSKPPSHSGDAVTDPPKARSFKEVLALPKSSDFYFDDTVDAIFSDNEVEDEDGDTNILHDDHSTEHSSIPKISLPMKLLQQIRKPWTNTLIVRLLDECNYVYMGGLWVIMDHYLTIRKWEPDFKASEAFETTTAVRITFLELPIEYFQEKKPNLAVNLEQSPSLPALITPSNPRDYPALSSLVHNDKDNTQKVSTPILEPVLSIPKDSASISPDIPMEEITEAPSNSLPSNPLSLNQTISLREGKVRVRKPLDPNFKHGRGKEPPGCFNPQDERQHIGSVVRDRNRSNSPSRQSLVDRANKTENRARESNTATPPLHSLQMASMRSTDQDHRRLRSIIPSLSTDPLPPFPSIDSLKILIWKCREAGNNTFRRNMRELLQTHKPGILVLLETKVTYSSMGNFFSNMGFSAATIVDPVGRSGGMWLIWDIDQVNVCASRVSNQYIQATIHKGDYEEWVFNAVYASPNPL
ncbi:hypothetical protein LOK49_LG07G02140 [Camellia lanceoleosa]|uniref:Uncharacterized protein n=1 Tax=Camellia lanceoleosa TaxID=1840588 RepID=A0ACC0GZ86_9ERIC|nr:hypothetical protein LOK49_LG07G02140 [Camellia lanceoleosa]